MRKTLFLFLLPIGMAFGQKLKFSDQTVGKTGLTEAQIYHKILGFLVGSGIGDAMGAPTEMWSREAIQFDFGFVNKLDSMVREPSPEGTWKMNLPAGGTTDDTRWKVLAFNFLSKQENRSFVADSWAKEILDEYQKSIAQYKEIDSLEPEPFEENTLRVAWLQEWARVSKAYLSKDLDAYAKSQSRFYGGEMVCAGLLYAPAFGLFFPNDPQRAYKEAYKLSIYDIGYARDLTALSAALTAQAMKPNLTQDEFWATTRNVDPEHFFSSRLVGRTSFRIFRLARSIVSEAKQDEKPLEKAFELLDKHLQDMPFHAGEIYLQSITAMLFTDLNFQKTMEFLVNYGRDNDTTAAFAGGILGAYHGFGALPEVSREKVMNVAKTELNLDLQETAEKLATQLIFLLKSDK